MGHIAGNQQNSKRTSYDNYSTDPRWVAVLLSRFKLASLVWEPAAGEGNIVRELKKYKYTIRATDLTTGIDFLKSKQRAKTIMTNPPFRLVDEFIIHSRNQSDGMVCLLLGWHLSAGGAKRYNTIFKQYRPTNILVIIERMKVDGKASQFNHA